MTEARRGERLFRAWSESTPPFDEETGRARFLEAYRGRRTRWRRRYILVAAAAAVACALVAWWRTPSMLRFATATGEGQTGAWLATGEANELPLTFSEGTQVVMGPDSRGRVEQLARTGATFLLERGEVRAQVIHRSGSDWRFEAGPFEVHVTGTALGLAWDPVRERFAVDVNEGSVVVTCPNVGIVQVVRGGEHCTVDLPSRTVHLSSDGTSPALPGRGRNLDGTSPALPGRGRNLDETEAANDAGGALRPSRDLTEAPQTAPSHAEPSASAASAAAAPVSWTKLEERGDYKAAYAAASRAGLESVLRSSSADELLRLAQVARLSGRADVERETLLVCRRRFPGTERAAVAAYDLGRASSPAEATGWFDAYLREQPNGPLAREALGRLVEARASTGNQKAARDAATRYLAQYPDGPHASVARRVLAGTHE